MKEEQVWLERASARTFSCGVGDAAEQLGLANMTFGLAKILLVQDRLGLGSQALFIGAPDATVTRNTRRWQNGFGYGGQVRWAPEIAVLDALPNGCGMLVGSTASIPDEERVRRAAAEARRRPLQLDGVELQYDLGDSNHFVDACELQEVLTSDLDRRLPAQLFVIHSSGHEHRASSAEGPGLYLHLSQQLDRRAERHRTPWGDLAILRGQQATDYYRFCSWVQDFNARRRELFADLLFGPHDTICNATHQGFRAPGVFHLGSYWFERHDPAPLFPLALGPDQPLFLLRALPNFAPEVLAELGWDERAEKLGLTDLLGSMDMLPHGGGYAYPQLQRLLRVEREGDRHRFVVQRPDQPPLTIDAVRPLPFAYRGIAVLERLVALRLAEPVARYRIRFVIKE